MQSGFSLAGIAMSYQIAQKVHACTDPHDPPAFVNNRARDVVDLVLLKGLAEETGSPDVAEIRLAAEDIFAVRAAEARQLGHLERGLPATVVAYPHWRTDYESAAKSAGLELGLEDAVAVVNSWLRAIGIGG